MKTVKPILALGAITLMSVSVASAAPVTPVGNTEDLPFGYFSGSATTLGATVTRNGGLTLALSAQIRGGETLANSGGVYSAPTGADGSGNALWNFQFHIDNGSGSLNDYTYSLSYGKDASSLVSFDPLAITDNGGPVGVGNSENLGFTFGSPFDPADGLLGAAIGFDPNADATYSFLLQAFDGNQNLVSKVAINVKAGRGGSVPDGGTSVALLGMALTAGAALRRKLA